MKKLSNVEVFLFDMDGTIYIGNNEIKGSFDTLRALQAKGKQVCFFTNNSSRSAMDSVNKLKTMGLDVDINQIYTSGQVTCEYIEENFKGKSVFVLGNEKLKSEFTKHNIKLDENNPDLLVLGFDTTLTYDKLYRFCIQILKGKYYIATHPDVVCPAEQCPMPDVGAIMLMIEATTGHKPDLIIGKPYLISGEGVKKRFKIPPKNIAMVGDRLYTDIQFGINNNFTSILVMCGDTTKEMAENSDIKADFVFSDINEIIENI